MMKGSDEKIEKIKQVAFSSFLEIGYEATTVRMLCNQAEIESPTLYYFFKSKKGLFMSLRNDLVEEYSSMVKGLNLEKCVNPEAALKKYFKFCMNYALGNNAKTRFYLRYRLFKPAELKSEIDQYIDESNKEKQELYLKYLKELIETGNINYSLEQIFHKFTNFINNSTFNIIFNSWEPSDEEINKEWDKFSNYYFIK